MRLEDLTSIKFNQCYVVFLVFSLLPSLVACALMVWLTIVLSTNFALSPETMYHFHTDQIPHAWRFGQFSFGNPRSRMFLIYLSRSNSGSLAL